MRTHTVALHCCSHEVSVLSQEGSSEYSKSWKLSPNLFNICSDDKMMPSSYLFVSQEGRVWFHPLDSCASLSPHEQRPNSDQNELIFIQLGCKEQQHSHIQLTQCLLLQAPLHSSWHPSPLICRLGMFRFDCLLDCCITVIMPVRQLFFFFFTLGVKGTSYSRLKG